MAKIDQLFQSVLEKDASDLHLSQGQPPKMRVHGAIKEMDEAILTEDSLCEYLEEICTDAHWDRFKDTGDLDFAYALGDETRFRCNYYKHVNGHGAIFRMIPNELLTIEKLGLPEVLTTFSDLNSGLVLVTGPTGSGKSTTLAAIIGHINSHHAKHILTVEDPIEFLHHNIKSVVVQREVGIDVDSFDSALLDAAHGDYDVILVGEMRDLETIKLAISAAEAGNLVFATLHTNSAAKTIDRIIDVFPGDEQPQIRTMLSESLKGVVSQSLLKRKNGEGRVAACEILLHTRALAGIIRDGGALNKLHSVMMSGRCMGMQIMDDVIEHYYYDGLIGGHEAYMKALDKDRFEQIRDNT
ncbi:MAG: PilT/PilU family type 4a pilus ATPase [Chloroflexi bacterium]|jgi:twitching motility protein PilT|nr:PilT/PilU family type 4a pilus ATPase [Chloroflexota bacterium]